MKTINQDELNAVAWRASDTCRGTIDPAQYKDYILVMLFLKYLSDAGFLMSRGEQGDFGFRMEGKVTVAPTVPGNVIPVRPLRGGAGPGLERTLCMMLCGGTRGNGFPETSAWRGMEGMAGS